MLALFRPRAFAKQTEGETVADPAESVDRRNMLRLGGMAAAGAAGAALISAVDAKPAGATSGTMVFGTTMNAGTAETELDSSCPGATLITANTGSGHAIVGNVSGPSSDKIAVYALTSGTGKAVLGHTTGSGVGVLGQVENTGSAGTGVQGLTNGTGSAVKAQIANAASGAAAIDASTNGSGNAVHGTVTNAVRPRLQSKVRPTGPAPRSGGSRTAKGKRCSP